MGGNSEQSNESFRDTLAALGNAIKGANRLVPGLIGISLALASFTILIIAKYLEVGLGCNLFLILFTSLVAYTSSQNYGEAAVALSAGLLALFSVNWDSGKAIGFFVAWVVFSFAALLIRTINLAAEDEDIYLDAALSISANKSKDVEKQLRKIASDAKTRKLGPIERAEVLRLFSYRKLPLDSMLYALKATETMTIITKTDHSSVASFVVDIYKMLAHG